MKVPDDVAECLRQRASRTDCSVIAAVQWTEPAAENAQQQMAQLRLHAPMLLIPQRALRLLRQLPRPRRLPAAPTPRQGRPRQRAL
jgi:hypothetical protein